MIVQPISAPFTTIEDPGPGGIFVPVDTASIFWVFLGYVFLPLTPQEGARVVIKDVGGIADARQIVVSGNTHLIDTASSYLIQVSFESITLVYDGSKWVVI